MVAVAVDFIDCGRGHPAVDLADVDIVARVFMTPHWVLDDGPRPDHRTWGPGFPQGSLRAFRDDLATQRCRCV